MSAIKWIFRLGIVLSFAWIAFSESPSGGNDAGVSASPLAKISSAVAGLREKAMTTITAELRSRGVPMDNDGPPMNFATLSAIAQSAISSKNGQSTSVPGGGPSLQSLVQQVSQLNGEQVVSQLQTKVQHLIQETGSPNMRATDHE